MSKHFFLRMAIVGSLIVAVLISAYLMLRRPAPALTSRTAIGVVSRFAGSGLQGSDDGPAASAGFADPFGVVLADDGSLIIADGSTNRIRRVSEGRVSTIAGSSEGFEDGLASTCSFNTPSGLAINRHGDLVIADTSNNAIRMLSRDGQIRTVAGNGQPGYRDGEALEAQFDGPIGVAVDPDGNIIVADTYNDVIRKVSLDGVVSTVAGSPRPGFSDGTGTTAQFDTPCGLAIDKQGNLFVADAGNDAIRRVAPTGEVITIAGGEYGRTDGIGSEAHFDHPTGLTITHDGFLFVTDEGSGLIRRITPEGEVKTIAGWRSGYADGIGTYARFNGPTGIVSDSDGVLYVADTNNYLIRRIQPAEEVTVIEPEPVPELFVQPSLAGPPAAGAAIPQFSIGPNLPWPLSPQEKWHEVSGVVGEARGAPGGIALNHLHSGLDIRANLGDIVLGIVDEKVSGVIPAWDYGASSEGIHVGAAGYIHLNVGRDRDGELLSADKFKLRLNEDSMPIGVRVRRGTRFRAGDPIGTVNRLYHVHLNIGPWNAQVNPLQYCFPGFTDHIAPVVEPGGIEIVSSSGVTFKEKRDGRLVIYGDVDIVVTAYDRVDGNVNYRRLGLYRAGYQLVKEDGTPAPGFEQPLVNIEFNRLPPNDEDVALVYASGSGVSAYGGATRFRYVVTNLVRDGLAVDGVLRTSSLAEGPYVLRVYLDDFAANRAIGMHTELLLLINDEGRNR